MCTDSVSHLLFEHEAIREKMAHPLMDFVHQQVLMTLYSLDGGKKLQECRELLPVYLSKQWSECETILRTLERVGLIAMAGDTVELTYPIHNDQPSLCGCG